MSNSQCEKAESSLLSHENNMNHYVDRLPRFRVSDCDYSCMLIANLHKKNDRVDDVLESCTTNKHDARQADNARLNVSWISPWD